MGKKAPHLAEPQLWRTVKSYAIRAGSVRGIVKLKLDLAGPRKRPRLVAGGAGCTRAGGWRFTVAGCPSS